MGKKLGLVVALASEARALLGAGRWQQEPGHTFRQISIGGGIDLIAVMAGVGPENALSAADWLISKGAVGLVNLGFAGGLLPGLQAGDLVVADQVACLDAYSQPEPWVVSGDVANDCLSVITAAGLSAQSGRVITSPRPIVTIEEKKHLHQHSLALVVDMESALVARAAREAGLPFLILRVVCDPAHQHVPRALSGCLDPVGRVRFGALCNKIMRHPALVVDLVRLGRQSARARRSLAKGWRALIENGCLAQMVHASGH